MLKLRLFLLFIIVFINILSYIIFPSSINTLFFNKIFVIMNELTNIKLNIHGDKEILKRKGRVIISNHYNACDFMVIYGMCNNIHTIVKHDLITGECSESILLKILSHFQKIIFKSFSFIPYKRGDKTSGDNIKENIVKIIKKKKNVLIFPEGTCTRDGNPKSFKSGLFRTCSEHNIPVIPLTLIYKRPIGLGPDDTVDLIAQMNNEVDVYIHDELYNSDWEKFRDDAFEIVCKPLKS